MLKTGLKFRVRRVDGDRVISWNPGLGVSLSFSACHLSLSLAIFFLSAFMSHRYPVIPLIPSLLTKSKETRHIPFE